MAAALYDRPATVLDWAEDHHEGHVLLAGERWRAHGEIGLHPGQQVWVDSVQGLSVKVSARCPAAAGPPHPSITAWSSHVQRRLLRPLVFLLLALLAASLRILREYQPQNQPRRALGRASFQADLRDSYPRASLPCREGMDWREAILAEILHIFVAAAVAACGSVRYSRCRMNVGIPETNAWAVALAGRDGKCLSPTSGATAGT